ncbi:hypothetical protein PInf_016464 [Phytophthora infestans]|nr:hypothetical protein PInf_016464 [Phytophthora infestans]
MVGTFQLCSSRGYAVSRLLDVKQTQLTVATELKNGTYQLPEVRGPTKTEVKRAEWSDLEEEDEDETKAADPAAAVETSTVTDSKEVKADADDGEDGDEAVEDDEEAEEDEDEEDEDDKAEADDEGDNEKAVPEKEKATKK